MRLEYNAPVILTFTLISTAVLIISQFAVDIMPFFTIYPVVEPTNPIWYLRLFSHVIGHGGWPHLVGNFTFILLIGPILEEKYGSRDLLFMMAVTALVTGVLHLIISGFGLTGEPTGLLGASGIVFMLILLSSVTNSKGGIPLTFVLIVILFLGTEVIGSFADDNISQLAHIIGGILGGIFGFFLKGRKVNNTAKKPVTGL
ncbi:MAG: rhomboid family intramembrane serine protease [Bacteroidota bacterium]